MKKSLQWILYATLACVCFLVAVAAWELGTKGEVHFLYVPLFAALGAGFTSATWFNLWPPIPHPLAREHRVRITGVDAVKEVLNPRRRLRRRWYNLWGLT